MSVEIKVEASHLFRCHYESGHRPGVSAKRSMARPAPCISIHMHEALLGVRLFARGPLVWRRHAAGSIFLGRGKVPAVTHRAGTVVWALPSLAGGAGARVYRPGRVSIAFAGFSALLQRFLASGLICSRAQLSTSRIGCAMASRTQGMIRTLVEDTSKLDP
jgi:hypothetical protein